MVFVPSLGGRSHCPEESTAIADLVNGVDVLRETLLNLDSTSA
jgi:N-carbamoyl-L-amino-acid hydrolase